ncbi:MaoC family dehydratase [Azoarcus sp. L1K30]|uniref:MaoC family dehydratase n=1 Tax=Azoarcus sp. L1K30 TaxID=2820277 RepID=UPI001B823A2D|nr:MaoC family dehydratase [Azoarcus sp. L1K30]MBR0565320.1 MaoC family dehydratase [Azoarcus sp. L1K30]
MAQHFARLSDLGNAVGHELAVGEWLTVDQSRINAFADVSGDDQWIHVDPVRAADSPFGGTIAHGLLLVSLAAGAVRQVETDDTAAAIVCGLDHVRFIHPVPAGAQIRARVSLAAWTPHDKGGEARWAVQVEEASNPRTAATFELVVRYRRANQQGQ